MKEFCTRFPMVDYQTSGMLLAVGSPFVAEGLSRHEGLAPGFGLGSGDVRGDAVAVFDMQAGSKTRALHYRYTVQTSMPAHSYSLFLQYRLTSAYWFWESGDINLSQISLPVFVTLLCVIQALRLTIEPISGGII